MDYNKKTERERDQLLLVSVHLTLFAALQMAVYVRVCTCVSTCVFM